MGAPWQELACVPLRDPHPHPLLLLSASSLKGSGELLPLQVLLSGCPQTPQKAPAHPRDCFLLLPSCYPLDLSPSLLLSLSLGVFISAIPLGVSASASLSSTQGYPLVEGLLRDVTVAQWGMLQPHHYP